MKNIDPMLLIDFYKAVHAEMLPKDITLTQSFSAVILTVLSLSIKE